MRKITIVALLAFLVFPVVASNLLLPAPSLLPTDTTYHFNDKVIVVTASRPSSLDAFTTNPPGHIQKE